MIILKMRILIVMMKRRTVIIIMMMRITPTLQEKFNLYYENYDNDEYGDLFPHYPLITQGGVSPQTVKRTAVVSLIAMVEDMR